MTDFIPPPSGLPAGSVVYAYLRDSGGDSQELSVAQQMEQVHKYCNRHGLVLQRVFVDEAKSGGTDKGREQFEEMISTTAQPDERPNGIVFWSLSRFCRNQNDGPYYRALLRKRGIIIHSMTEPLPDDPTAIVIEAVYDFTNAEKLRQTSRDVKRGQAWLLQQGYATGGIPPRGYIAIRESVGTKRDGQDRMAPRWVEDPERWELGQQVWRMFADGATYDDLQRFTGGKFYKNKQTWSSFFRNRAYLGIGVCGDLEISNHHPAMVDQPTFDRVMARLKTNEGRLLWNSPTHPRRIHAPSLLSGIAVCHLCGAAMCHRVQISGNYKWPHYVCGQKVRRGGAACPAKRVGMRDADNAIFDGVLGQVLTTDMIAELLEEVKKRMADTSGLDTEAKRLDKQIIECKRSIRNLLELAETFGAHSAASKLVERESELAGLQYNRHQIETKRQAAQIEITPEALAAVLASWRADLARAREAGDVPAAKRLLTRFVSRIELEYNRAKLNYTFPLHDNPDMFGVPVRGR